MPFANLNGQITRKQFKSKHNQRKDNDSWVIKMHYKEDRGELNLQSVYYPKHLVGKRVKVYWILEEEEQKFDK